MPPRTAFILLGTLLTVILGCTRSAPSIVGKWSGSMTATCPHPLPQGYRPLSISLDLTADGRCTNVRGSGIGADITMHGTYRLLDSLFLFTSDWGTDTLTVATFTATELVLRRAKDEAGCIHSFSMTREAAPR